MKTYHVLVTESLRDQVQNPPLFFRVFVADQLLKVVFRVEVNILREKEKTWPKNGQLIGTWVVPPPSNSG